MVHTKICTKCKKKKPATLEFFHKQPGGKFNLKAHCKVCQKKYKKKYREANKEKIAKSRKEWQENNKDKLKGYMKKYFETPKGKEARKRAKIKRAEKRAAKKLGLTVDEMFDE